MKKQLENGNKNELCWGVYSTSVTTMVTSEHLHSVMCQALYCMLYILFKSSKQLCKIDTTIVLILYTGKMRL